MNGKSLYALELVVGDLVSRNIQGCKHLVQALIIIGGPQR